MSTYRNRSWALRATLASCVSLSLFACGSSDDPSGVGGTTGGTTGGTGGSVATGGSTSSGGSSSGGEDSGGSSSGGTGIGGALTGGADGSGGSAPATCPDTISVQPGDSNESVMVGGMNRTYVLHVPPGYTGETPVPVVIDYHPLGGTGSGQKNASGWAALGDQKGFITVLPDGVGNSWNVGRCCEAALNQNVDDVAFTRAIIAQLETKACIDLRRIYASGCSNGGGMAYKIACEAGDMIAGVAPVDFDCVVGPTNEDSSGGCDPGRPITQVQFRATGDFAVAYEGGQAPIPPTMRFPGAQANFEDWADKNMCTGAPETLTENAACETYPTCGAGVENMLCTQQGGGHCSNYGTLDIVRTAWEIFERQTLP